MNNKDRANDVGVLGDKKRQTTKEDVQAWKWTKTLKSPPSGLPYRCVNGRKYDVQAFEIGMMTKVKDNCKA
jgi:hypothetical protein